MICGSPLFMASLNFLQVDECCISHFIKDLYLNEHIFIIWTHIWTHIYYLVFSQEQSLSTLSRQIYHGLCLSLLGQNESFVCIFYCSLRCPPLDVYTPPSGQQQKKKLKMFILVLFVYQFSNSEVLLDVRKTILGQVRCNDCSAPSQFLLP